MLIKDFELFSLHKVVGIESLPICEFVINLYYKFHKQNVSQEIIRKDIRSIHQEELNLFSESHIYVIFNRFNEIVGTIRAGLWNKREKLPLQNEFNIDISNFNISGQIWHIGRFAIDSEVMKKELLGKRIFIFKTLLYHAISHVCSQDNNVMFAECDRKLHEKVKLLNINSKVIGKPKQYIGSETIPICNTSQDLKSFLWNHKHLQCTVEIESTLPKSNKIKSLNQKCFSPEQVSVV